MTRDQWKAFFHSIRADVRAFRRQYGGWPCFSRVFHAQGNRWHLERSADRSAPDGQTLIWRPLPEMPIALERIRLMDAAFYRRHGDFPAARRSLAASRANRHRCAN